MDVQKESSFGDKRKSIIDFGSVLEENKTKQMLHLLPMSSQNPWSTTDQRSSVSEIIVLSKKKQLSIHNNTGLIFLLTLFLCIWSVWTTEPKVDKTFETQFLRNQCQ